MMDFADKMSPLGNAVAEDCANYCVMMFSDFTRKVTMQNTITAMRITTMTNIITMSIEARRILFTLSDTTVQVRQQH